MKNLILISVIVTLVLVSVFMAASPYIACVFYGYEGVIVKGGQLFCTLEKVLPDNTIMGAQIRLIDVIQNNDFWHYFIDSFENVPSVSI